MLDRGAPDLLQIENLTVMAGSRPIVREINLSIAPGEVVGLIGESGSGKSTIALAVMSYLAAGVKAARGRIMFSGENLVGATRLHRCIYGKRIAHVAQDPAAALNPVLRIGTQLTEGMRKHLRLSATKARERALNLLEEVHLPGGEDLLGRYPYELSGGMQQRICIAMALACDPELLVLDEPTTGLDARTEGAILEILAELKRRRKLSALLISHNIRVISDIADRVAVLYGGRLMECGPIGQVLERPAHRYTKLLLNAAPGMSDHARALADIPWQEFSFPETGCPFRGRCDLAVPACAEPLFYRDVARGQTSACARWQDAARPADHSGLALRPRRAAAEAGEPCVALNDVSFSYQRRRLGEPKQQTLSGIDLAIGRGEIVALIGESGSGKSTLARLIVGLLRPQQGSIRLNDRELTALRRYPLSVSRRIQIVFQNIAGSLHPRKRVSDIIARPFRLYEGRAPSEREINDLFAPLGLRKALLPKRPGALSGGERQRAALARGTAPRPDAVILDEAFSALDVSMKVRVARMLLERCRALGTSILFVTHDLPFVRYVADRVAVLYRGWICEKGPVQAVLEPPYHPYTEALIWAARRLEGERPTCLDLTRSEIGRDRSSTTGCPYHSECQRKIGTICETTLPPLVDAGPGHKIACHIPLADLAALQKREYQVEEKRHEVAL
jgi:peptide/nickel transport system ATP-binding protein